MSNHYAIESQGLSKRYDGDLSAVDDVDLAIPTNCIYALLGPNGAEKTTMVSMVRLIQKLLPLMQE